jgi:hypothetical protein
MGGSGVDGKGFLVQVAGSREVAHLVQHLTEIVRRIQGVCMVFAQDPPLPLQGVIIYILGRPAVA